MINSNSVWVPSIYVIYKVNITTYLITVQLEYAHLLKKNFSIFYTFTDV